MALLVAMLTGLANTDLTVYHVNPLHEGVVPVNMVTADLRGEMFFDFGSKVLPIECASNPQSKECTNEEVDFGSKVLPIECASNPQSKDCTNEDVVITKLILSVKGEFGEYGRCNACNASDIDPFSRLPCHGQNYLCTCGNFENASDCSSQKPAGAENITNSFGHFGMCSWDNWIKAPWACWGFSVINKTAGPGKNMWYSSTAAGWCDAPGASPATCTWSAKVLKIVNKTCSDNSVHRAVEEYDALHDGRFAKCPHSTPGPSRNISDVCWIYSFYATVLGPEALLPGGAMGGMPIELLDEAFDRPFNDEAQGGCPAISPPEEAAPRLGARRGDGHRSFGVLQSPAPELQAAFRAAAQMAVEEVEKRKRRPSSPVVLLMGVGLGALLCAAVMLKMVLNVLVRASLTTHVARGTGSSGGSGAGAGSSSSSSLARVSSLAKIAAMAQPGEPLGLPPRLLTIARKSQGRRPGGLGVLGLKQRVSSRTLTTLAFPLMHHQNAIKEASDEESLDGSTPQPPVTFLSRNAAAAAAAAALLSCGRSSSWGGPSSCSSSSEDGGAFTAGRVHSREDAGAPSKPQPRPSRCSSTVHSSVHSSSIVDSVELGLTGRSQQRSQPLELGLTGRTAWFGGLVVADPEALAAAPVAAPAAAPASVPAVPAASLSDAGAAIRSWFGRS